MKPEGKATHANVTVFLIYLGMLSPVRNTVSSFSALILLVG